jgi:O-methyltransferase
LKKTVLFGAGQAGSMILRLLGCGYEAVCFADNSPQKQQLAQSAGLSVLSAHSALELKPDAVCICVTDAERTRQIEMQLRQAGFNGELLSARDMLRFDARAASMRMLAKQIADRGVKGDIAELGVYKGSFSALMNAALPDRTLHLFDTFTGFTEDDVRCELQRGCSHAEAGDFSDTCVEYVLKRLPHPERAVIHAGYFPDTFIEVDGSMFSMVSIDADLYAPTAAALPLFWEQLSEGGAIIVHDYNSEQFAGVGAATREFCERKGLFPVPLSDLHGSAVLIKQSSGAQ